MRHFELRFKAIVARKTLSEGTVRSVRFRETVKVAVFTRRMRHQPGNDPFYKFTDA